MLETDEVDVDYFTPAEGTSLANIFNKASQIDEAKNNTSLKYIPPPPPGSKPEEVKRTQWIFTCAVHGFEWSNSAYISKGKLGLAILKSKTNSHSIILYDSNKTTLSCATVSSKLKVHKRDVLTISYYDNLQKYWSIQTSDDDLKKILELLESLQVNIIHKSSQETDKEQSDNVRVENHEEIIVEDKENKEEKETDTDAMNQKTKDSILKRMANMGHSVLPSHTISKGQTSDSSDVEDVDENKKNIRHKPGKSINRRNMELNLQEPERSMLPHCRKVVHKDCSDGPAVVPSKRATSPSSTDMSILVSEQRINNTELKINVNRMSDRIDLILERLTDVSNMNRNSALSNFQNDIVQKLIKEYESKIRYYEQFMASKGIDCHSINFSVNSNTTENNDNIIGSGDYGNNIAELEKKCAEKDTKILSLKEEVTLLNEKYNMAIQENKQNTEVLLKEIDTLNQDLTLRKDKISSLLKEIDNNSENNTGNSDTVNKVKKIMNDTFQAITANFDNEETYTGESIKTTIAMVIKVTTIEALKELQ